MLPVMINSFSTEPNTIAPEPVAMRDFANTWVTSVNRQGVGGGGREWHQKASRLIQNMFQSLTAPV